MKKPTLKSDATIKALSFILAASVGLTACEAPKATKSDKGISGEAGNANNGQKDGTESKDGKDGNSTATKPEATSGGTAAGTGDTNATANGAGQVAPQGRSELDDLPQLSAVRTVSLSKLRDSLVICTVDGTPITVDQFKRQFREALLSLQSVLTQHPEKVNELLNDARQMNVSLTDDERKRLLETARHPEALDGKTFSQFIKEKKITEDQFNQEVLMLGLAFKTGTKIIESQLLSEMINRELLLQAARNAGLYHVAMNKFIEFKHTQDYDRVIKASTETAEQIKDEIINHEMMKLEMEQIAKQGDVSDDVLKQEYVKNKESFKHGERVRLSHIVIAAPAVDNPPLESIRTQIKNKKPKITPDELDKEAKVLEMQQHNNAAELLARAQKGEDFKTLADRYTDDVQSRARKAGGDLGYLDLSIKIKGSDGGKSDQEKLCDAVKGLKAGNVAPELVHTAYGWHIVKLTDRQAAGYLSFDEVKGTLKQLLGQQNQQLAEATWIKNKRKNASIKLSDEFIKLASREKGAPGDKPVVAQ